jgi:ATP-dependent Zn protease
MRATPIVTPADVIDDEGRTQEIREGSESFLDAYAWCMLRKAFRPYLNRDAAFTGIVVVPYDELINYAERAAAQLFGRSAARRFTDEKDATSFLMSHPKSRQFVLIFNDVDHIPHAVKDTAEMYMVVGKPNAQSITAAFYQFFGKRVKAADAEFLTYFSASTLNFAFRGRGQFEQVLARLRRSVDTKPLLCAPAAQKLAARRQVMKSKASRAIPEKKRSSPELLAKLSGYGEAVTWGVQLCQDLDNYRDKKIGWESVERGLLLHGPSGIGKSQFARVLAEACNVPLFSGSYGEWQKKGHQGDMLKAMKQTFEDAIRHAPSILLVDEVDGFHVRGSSEDAMYNRAVTNAFLECLDGAKSREGVVVVATTNDIKIIDPAILRSGRVDTHIEIGLPDGDARCNIIARYLGSDIPAPDRDEVIRRTSGLSGADLEVQVRRARRAARSASEKPALGHLLATLPPMSRVPDDLLWSWALHEGGHAVAGLAFGRTIKTVHIDHYVVEGSSGTAGAVAFAEQNLIRHTRSVLEDELMILLAGLASETLVLGSHDVGGTLTDSSDLSRATRLATKIELIYGMGSRFTSESLQDDTWLDRIRQGNSFIAKIVDVNLKDMFDQVTAILKANRAALDALAEKLLATPRLTGIEVLECLQQKGLSISRTSYPDSDLGSVPA